jgi:pyridoxal phosphate enzyme (YggS family)
LDTLHPQNYSYISSNLSRIRENVALSALRLGIPAPEILAVTKSAESAEVEALVRLFGQKMIGENRTSLFCERFDLFSDGERPEMHLIGSLQTNKVKYIAGKTALIHSLDSERLAAEIEKQAAKRDIKIRVLLEINCACEDAKGGVMPKDAERFAETIKSYEHLSLAGVMTMGPVLSSEEGYRPYFRETAKTFRELSDRGYFEGTPVLSMGMSGSYRVAVEEGSTLIRVGRALFVK